jgi:purine-nucleoside phosphorylase
MKIPSLYVRRYWFGLEDESAIASTVLLMERDRLEQYKAAFDLTLCQFKGVFSGITGIYNGHRISVVYSIGPAHIVDCVSYLTNGFQIKRLITTGSVGGLAAEMGDLIVADTCTTQDGFSLVTNWKDVQHDEKLGPFIQIDITTPHPIPQHIHEHIKLIFNCNILHGPIFTVPAVCLESVDQLNEIKRKGFIALDLESGPFLAACRQNNLEGLCLHWVTDLPLERNFYYPYEGELDLIERDIQKKHRQWLNMPRLILPIIAEWTKCEA